MDDLDEWLDARPPLEGDPPSDSTRVLDRRALWESIEALAPRPPLTIGPDAAVGDAIRLLREHGIGCVLVEEGGRLVGILTERDVLQKLEAGDVDQPVRRYMTPDPEVLAPADPIVFVLNKMSVGGFRHVPLVDGEHRPVGVVSVKDVVGFLAEVFAADVLTCAPEQTRSPWRDRDGG